MTRARDWIRPAIQEMRAYPVAASDPTMLKLDAMEAPQDFPPALKSEWAAMLHDVALNRYPAAHNAQLADKLRARFAIPADQQIIFGNGSDEFIQMLQIAVAGVGRTILAPTPSFVMYEIVARLLGLEFVGVDLRADDFSLDVPAMLAAMAKHQPAIVFLACPNNPTGNLFARADVEQIIAAAPGLVVLDEAYHAYASAHYADLVAKYAHVVVMRTLSKVGFAGLRFGYLFGAPEWIGEIDKVRPPYNVNVVTQASIDFALQHYDAITPQIAEICAERAIMMRVLANFGDVWPSEANFILLRTPRAAEILAALRAKGVLLKNLHGAHPLLANCLRVTVSNAAENARLLRAWQEIGA